MSSGENVKRLLASAKEASAAGDYDSAIEQLSRAVQFASEEWGEDSFQLVHPLMGLSHAIDRGRAMQVHSDVPKMIELQKRALTIARAHTDKYESELYRLVATCGFTLRRAKQYEDALPYFEESVALSERSNGESWSTSHALVNLASLLTDMSRQNEALPIYERALKMERLARPDKTAWATRVLLGKCLLDLERYEDALQHFEAVLEIRKAKSREPGLARRELDEWAEKAREGITRSG